MKNEFIEELEVNELPVLPERDSETGECDTANFSLGQDFDPASLAQ
jgi:hypothetical protein